LNVSTTAEIFETKYHSAILKKTASFLSILSMFGFLIGQVVASKKLLLGLGVNSELLFISLWLFIIIYTVMGGLKAVVITDIYQVLIILFSFVGLFIYALMVSPETLSSLIDFSSQKLSVLDLNKSEFSSISLIGL